MKLQHLLLVAVVSCLVPGIRAERVLWTETATVRTKTLFADDGTVLYQQNWDKATREPIGTPIDRREAHEAWQEAIERGPAHYGTRPGPGHPMPEHGAPAGSPRYPHHARSGPEEPPPQPYYGTPGSYADAQRRQEDWLPGPFTAPAETAPRFSASPPTNRRVDPVAAFHGHPSASAPPPVATVGGGHALDEPGGRMNPDPEWTRLYEAARAPLPERDAHGLPPPPVEQPPQAPLEPRPAHPETPGQTDFRWYNRVGGKVLMRPDNMIRVKVMDRLTSGRNKRGDTFRFVILEPILYGLRTLVPAGTRGIGRIGRAKSRGLFGRPGMLDLEFGSVDLPGATPARIYLAETVIHPAPKEPEALAAGAIGLLAFGPLGLAGGAVIKGRDVVVEPGTVFHVEVAVDVPYMHTAGR